MDRAILLGTSAQLCLVDPDLFLYDNSGLVLAPSRVHINNRFETLKDVKIKVIWYPGWDPGIKTQAKTKEI